MTRIALVAIRGYQLLVSPLLPPSCRFFPSCSHYSAQALERHGVLGGLRLVAWRLARCQPFGRPGYDPIP